MPDIVAPAVRKRMMAGIQGKDTKPEIILRRALHARGLRYRLHDQKLPGRPDLVFPRHRAAIFVNGCFWHMHEGCSYFRMPATRTDFWQQKLEANRTRDRRAYSALDTGGWRVCVLWECATRHRPDESAAIVESWIRDGGSYLDIAWTGLDLRFTTECAEKRSQHDQDHWRS